MEQTLHWVGVFWKTVLQSGLLAADEEALEPIAYELLDEEDARDCMAQRNGWTITPITIHIAHQHKEELAPHLDQDEGWVSVKDRLPEGNFLCWIALDDRSVHRCLFYSYDGVFGTSQWHFFDRQRVTHWRKVIFSTPKPPGEGA